MGLHLPVLLAKALQRENSVSLKATDGGPVHYPNNPDKFEFDSEVAGVFDDMAQRSIPQYTEVHRLHSRILMNDFIYSRPAFTGRPRSYLLLDIGASTGFLFKTLHEMGRKDNRFHLTQVEMYAVDPSLAMLEIIQRRFPNVYVYAIKAREVEALNVQFDAVAMHYVLQFIPEDEREETMRAVHSVMKPNALLLYGQKAMLAEEHLATGNEHYYDFRRSNGYTNAEIVAKTQALSTSMWPWSQEDILKLFKDTGFHSVQETMRWAMFNAMVCRARA